MTAVQLIQKVRRQGIELKAAGNRIRYRPPDALTENLRAELRARKEDVLKVLRSEVGAARWNPLVPEGWTASAWHGRLIYMARICMHADRGEELKQWADAVRQAHGLSTEVDE